VAVVQISKIQVRRGQKNSNSGIPQLSSAEFAWAVDSQELFIGNGSVLEGAPYVGNTKILTEHDNILDLAASYRFANDDTSITLSVPRSLQNKIDETYVSVSDFGAVGDGSTDCVSAFETAVTQLFRNANTNYKKVLVIPNGEYLFTSDLALPAGVILQGETRHGVILNIGANNIRCITSTGLELVEFNSTNRPQNIDISNLTISRTTGQIVLSGVANSLFSKLNFQGTYVLGTAVASLATEPAAVFWENTLAGTKTDNILFRDCAFEGVSVAVKCLQTAVYNTEIKFENSRFFVNDTAIYIDGVATQGNNWTIYDCVFEEIDRQAFRSTNGQGTIINRSKFKNVANGTNTAANPDDVMVYFGEQIGNVVVACTSNRQQAAGMTSVDTKGSFVEVYNAANVNFVDRNYALINLSDSFRPLAVFSSLNKFTVINYCLRLGGHTRFGTLQMTIGDDLAGVDDVTNISFTDNYTYSPNIITALGGPTMTNFEFNATLTNPPGGDSSLSTVLLSYKNPLASGQTGSISFDVAYGV
jgi:hypothetical protein